MFSGIVETQSRVLRTRPENGLLRIEIERPQGFDDLKRGDSVCTNGVCLTIEDHDERLMTFALGAETLQITGWNESTLQGALVNVERSLRMGDRIHGHMVTGHVDGVGEIVSAKDLGGSLELRIRAPHELLPFLWRKGSWAVNGVSLTINSVEDDLVSVCLIPETLSRTNLGRAEPGMRVNLEVDSMARAMVQFLKTSGRPS